MAGYNIDAKLNDRLVRQARRLGKSPEECVAAAIRAWVGSAEEEQALGNQLGGGVARPPDGFYD